MPMMPRRSGSARPSLDELIEARQHVADVAAAHVAHDERGELRPRPVEPRTFGSKMA